MSRLVNQLLLLNRLDSLNFTEKFEEVEISKLVSLALNHLPINKVENHQWHIDVSSIRIICDETLIVSVLTNLLSNAMKFSPKGSKIQVVALETANRVIIKVADEGKGVPKETLERLGSASIDFKNIVLYQALV